MSDHNELLERLADSQKSCFDRGLNIAAMDIQSAREFIIKGVSASAPTPEHPLEDNRWISEAKATLDHLSRFLQKTGAPHRVDWQEWIDSADRHLGLKWPSETATPSTAICAVSPPSPDTVREKDRADLAEKHLNQIYDYLGCCRSGSAVICTIKEREAALSSAPVAGAWQEVLKPFADLADAMYVSGHCGGASPEDWPDKWPISTTGGRDQHMPQSQGGVLTVADFRKLSRIYHSLSRNDRGGSRS